MYTYTNTEHNRFFLKLLIVKARIIFSALPPDRPRAAKVKEFEARFEDLYNRARGNPVGEELQAFNRETRRYLNEFRELVLGILGKLLTEEYTINLKPSFINSMVSIFDHYDYLLGVYLKNEVPRHDPLLQDIFWLPVFIADARLIADNLEFFDEESREKADRFVRSLSTHYQFAITVQGFLRTGLKDFPIVRIYRESMGRLVEAFATFVVDLLQRAKQYKLPGTVTLLELDCTYRVLCYYNTQLTVYTNAPKPTCDPGVPALF